MGGLERGQEAGRRGIRALHIFSAAHLSGGVLLPSFYIPCFEAG